MNERFPQFVLKAKSDGELFWEGILITKSKVRYLVNIHYPRDYPYAKPKFRIIKPRIRKGSPHLYSDNTLCVYPNNWSNKRSTAPAGVPLLSAWLVMYEFWLRTGKSW